MAIISTKRLQGETFDVPDEWTKEQKQAHLDSIVESRKPTVQAPIETEQPTAETYPEMMARSYFPRRMAQEESPEAESGASQLLASLLDVASIPGRALASAPTGGETMRQTKGQSMLGDILRSPSTALSLAVPSAGATGTLISRIPSLATTGARMGAVSGTTSAGERLLAGEPLAPEEIAKETVASSLLSPAIGAFGSGAYKAVKGAISPVAKLSAKLALPGAKAEQMVEDLAEYGFGKGQGAQKIREYAGKEKEIGEDLLSTMKQISSGEAENPIIKDAIQKMPKINVGSTINKIETSKINPKDYGGKLAKWQEKVNDELDDLSNQLRGKKKIANRNIEAEQLLNIRRSWDKMIDFDEVGSKANSYLNKSLKDIRGHIKDELISSAEKSGNPQYVDAMAELSNKLKAVEDLSDIGGKTLRENPEQFINTLSRRGKRKAQEAVSEIEKISGKEFLSPMNYASRAERLGVTAERGELPLFSRATTGLGAVGPLSALSGIGTSLSTGSLTPAMAGIGLGALSSPRLAAAPLSYLVKKAPIDLPIGISRGMTKATTPTLSSLLSNKREK